MGLFDDVSKFLETRIDEFLKNNPHLELQALDEKLREQEIETTRLIGDLQGRQKQVETQILETAQDVKRWHDRIQKAKAAGRQDLVEPAQSHEANLIRQGNQLWGHMEILKDRLNQTQTVRQKIQSQRQEVKIRLEQAKAARAAEQAQRAAAAPTPTAATSAWSSGYVPKSMDPLEEKFAKWEADEDIQRIKRDLGKSS
jgi:uncharacterized protein (TIGR04376 family)